MNILHITTYLQGGAGKIILELATHQSNKGYNVSILYTEEDITGYCNYIEYIQEAEKNKIRLYPINSTFKRDYAMNFKVIQKLKQLLVDQNIDIIHSHAAIPSMIGIIAKLQIKNKYIPIIQTMHGWGTNKTKDHELMDCNILKAIDKVITVSQADKELLINKGCTEDIIEVIYNGVSEEVHYEQSEVRKQIIQYKREGYKVIGCIGSICARKNQQLLIKAIQEIKEKIAIILIGEIDHNSFNPEEMKVYDRHPVKYLGCIEKAYQYIKEFDFLCLPSKSEGFSIVLIEACREKTPIICSDIECFKEIVEHGVSGYMFKNENKESLLTTLQWAMQDKNRQGIVDTAYSKYEMYFTDKKMKNSYEEQYIQLLSK